MRMFCQVWHTLCRTRARGSGSLRKDPCKQFLNSADCCSSTVIRLKLSQSGVFWISAVSWTFRRLPTAVPLHFRYWRMNASVAMVYECFTILGDAQRILAAGQNNRRNRSDSNLPSEFNSRRCSASAHKRRTKEGTTGLCFREKAATQLVESYNIA